MLKRMWGQKGEAKVAMCVIIPFFLVARYHAGIYHERQAKCKKYQVPAE
jgi:hypothetical protein